MPDGPRIAIVTPRGLISRLWWFFRRAWIAAYEDNCFGVAKGAAYSALLSFFPVLTTTTAILVQANAEAVSRVLTRILFQVAPPGTQALLRHFLSVQGNRPASLLVIATVLSVWAASGAMMSLMEGFQAAYNLPGGRSFLRQRAVAALLVICAVAPLVFGSAIILFGTRSEIEIIRWLHLAPVDATQLAFGVVILGRALRDIAAFGSIMLAAALLYYIGPNRPLRFASVIPGALFATVLWLIATQLFGWYVRNLANYNVLYGSIAAVIALTVWMYVLAVVTLVGCEFNVIIENDRRVRSNVRR
ncbi:MAG: YihY/virulence factor BrkB family protein [Acidobacteria bacterium]|nr:YihY/virulence factor BrkB family protein [Acidobacteriota bacterium]